MSRVTERYARGEVVLGTYASFGSSLEVEILANAGLDFVRIDGYKYDWPDDVVSTMVAACRRNSITPWARTRSDPEQIARYIELGVEALTVPAVESAREAESIVRAASARPVDFILGCQIETEAGLANLEEIVTVDGVDVIHSGRTDLARFLAPTEGQLADVVLRAEDSIVAAALAAGKIFAMMYPIGTRGESMVASAIDRGIRIFAIDNDAVVLGDQFAQAVARIRGGETA